MSDREPDARGSFADLRRELASLKSLAESCSRQLRAWADNLQNSDIKGQRHLTRAQRERYDAARRADAFWKQVDAVVQARSTPANCSHD